MYNFKADKDEIQFLLKSIIIMDGLGFEPIPCIHEFIHFKIIQKNEIY